MTHKELEAAAGFKVDPKMVMVLAGDVMFRRLGDGSWEPYPDYPRPPS